MINIRKLEAELWESADLLRQGSKLTSSQYCMPVLALLFLRYAYSRYKMVEAEILQNRPSRGGRVMPVEPSDFAAKSALYLPREAQFDYLVNLPDNIVAASLKTKDGQAINSLGEAVNNAMQLVEDQSEQLTGVLPKTYTMFADDLLRELLRIFNNKTIDEVGGDIIGRIYEYFLSKFSSKEGKGEFYTPKPIVKIITEMIQPLKGRIFDPCCGSGGMFVQSMKLVQAHNGNKNDVSIYGQEYTLTTLKLAKMNLAIRGISANFGDHNDDSLRRDLHKDLRADYVMANPPFNQKEWGADELEEKTGKCYDGYRQTACFLRCDADMAEDEYRELQRQKKLKKN